jgi:D-glycero-beta-D-manno-heptose 1-phosphate adenylyltransferase
MIVSIKEFSDIRKEIRAEGLKLVFTNGCFDIIHRGHIAYLNEAKSLGDILVIGMNSDSSVRQLKGYDRPVNNQTDRAFILDNLKPVDYVIIFDEGTPYKLIKKIVPDILVKGGDWKEDEIVGSDIVKKKGGKVFSLKFIENYSSSGIIKKLKETKIV